LLNGTSAQKGYLVPFKITKFFYFERRTTSITSSRAYDSALKMLAVSGDRTHLVLSRWTTALID